MNLCCGGKGGGGDENLVGGVGGLGGVGGGRENFSWWRGMSKFSTCEE